MPHLCWAAFRAICDRFLAVSFSALAIPPFDAPSLDKATAAGFFFFSGADFSSGVPSMCSPIRSSTTERAKRFGSLGRFLLAREGMIWYCRMKTSYVHLKEGLGESFQGPP